MARFRQVSPVTTEEPPPFSIGLDGRIDRFGHFTQKPSTQSTTALVTDVPLFTETTTLFSLERTSSLPTEGNTRESQMLPFSSFMCGAAEGLVVCRSRSLESCILASYRPIVLSVRVVPELNPSAAIHRLCSGMSIFRMI